MSTSVAESRLTQAVKFKSALDSAVDREVDHCCAALAELGCELVDALKEGRCDLQADELLRFASSALRLRRIRRPLMKASAASLSATVGSAALGFGLDVMAITNTFSISLRYPTDIV